MKAEPGAGGRTPPAPNLLFRAAAAAALVLAAVPAGTGAAAWGAPKSLASAIKSEADSKGIKQFYRARSYRPLWIQGGTVGPAADRLIGLVATGDLDGLDPDDYRPRALIEAVERARQRPTRKALAKAEALLSESFADYARDVAKPRDIGMVYIDQELVPTAPAPRAVLEQAATAPSLADYLGTIGWMNPLYGQLRQGLASYDRRAGPPVHIPAGQSLRTGSRDERVRLLRHRLGLADGLLFDAGVESALKRFQSARGLPADGIAGPRTLAALNEDPAEQAAVIRLNLERARALPAGRWRRQIVVDAASARLWLYENGSLRDTMRVVVGKPSEPTPMMAGMMRYAVVNPYWNIPPDLARLRIAPKAMKDPTWVTRNRYEVLSDWSEDAVVVDPRRVDWAAVAAGRQELRVRQLPGKGNAMGRMKFMMPNDLGVYLHDSPERELFRKEERRFSSGCVRLEDAPRLAKWLYGEPLVATSSRPEQQVPLSEPVPVFLTYLTAAPTEDGIAFRDDPYGRDRALLARMNGRSYAAR